VPLGERRLKGFAEKVPVFRFEWRVSQDALIT